MFIYDIEGRPSILKRYNGKNTLLDRYYYFINQLNEVIWLINNEEELIVEYGYLPYGEVVIDYDKSGVSLGIINPIRYKCYYYDEETQLCWVSSRYYSPELCRWISPDSIEYLDPQSINGLNLYCYCYNTRF